MKYFKQEVSELVAFAVLCILTVGGIWFLSGCGSTLIGTDPIDDASTEIISDAGVEAQSTLDASDASEASLKALNASCTSNAECGGGCCSPVDETHAYCQQVQNNSATTQRCLCQSNDDCKEVLRCGGKDTSECGVSAGSGIRTCSRFCG